MRLGDEVTLGSQFEIIDDLAEEELDQDATENYDSEDEDEFLDQAEIDKMLDEVCHFLFQKLNTGLPADLKNLKKNLKFGFWPKKPKISQNDLKWPKIGHPWPKNFEIFVTTRDIFDVIDTIFSNRCRYASTSHPSFLH